MAGSRLGALGMGCVFAFAGAVHAEYPGVLVDQGGRESRWVFGIGTGLSAFYDVDEPAFGIGFLYLW